MRLSCKEIPVRIWIIVLIFTTRFLMMSISQSMRFCWKHMIETPHDERYKPWCFLTSQERLEAVRIPWHKENTTNDGSRHKWTIEDRRYVSEAQIYGQMISCALGGILAENIGSFYVLLYSTSMAAILNIGRVIIADTHFKKLIILELVLGIHLGLVFPATYSWIARWAPPNERGVFTASIVGNGFGNCLTRVIFRYMIPLFGWQWVLYASSVITILHLIPLWFLGSNNPEDRKRISTKELMYIKESQRERVTSTRSFPPLGKILGSGAFWSINILNFGASCSHFYFLYEVADFLYNFMGIPRDVVEIIEVFPHIGFSIIAIAAALLGDYARTKRVMDDTTIIKINIFFSHLGPGCVLMFMGATYCSHNVAIALLFLGYASSGFCVISCYRTIIDISPNYAGTVYGIVHVPVSLVQIIVPRLTRRIFMFSSELIGWTLIFLIGGGCLCGTGVIFLYFGTAKTQWWNLKSQDIYKLYHYKKPEQRPSLQRGSNVADTSRMHNEQKKNNLFDKSIDIDREEWKPIKGKTSTVSGGGPSLPKVISSRTSEHKRMDSESVFETSGEDRPTTSGNLPETEHRENVSRTDDRFSPNNTLSIVSESILYSSEYLKGLTEPIEKRKAKSRTTMLHGTHTEFPLGDSMYGTTQQDLNYFNQIPQKRPKSYPDLRWMNPGESGTRNKYDNTKVLESALDELDK